MKTKSLAYLVLLVGGCSGGRTASPVTAPALTVPAAVKTTATALELGAAIHKSRFAYRADDNGYAAKHSTYQVRVEQAGAWSFSPAVRGPAKIAKTASSPLRIETLGRRAAASRLESDGSLTIERDGAVETLRNSGHGVEQSWRFAERPSSGGDLVVEVAVSGQDYLTSTDRGLHFIDKASGLGTRYGTATWVDAAGGRTTIRPTYSAGRISLVVPASLISSSTFPAVLDPEVEAETAVDTAPPGDVEKSAQVASDGNLWLVTWLDSRTAPQESLFGIVLNADGTPHNGMSSFQIGASFSQFNTPGNGRVVYSPTAGAFIAAYIPDVTQAGGGPVLAAKINASGTVLLADKALTVQNDCTGADLAVDDAGGLMVVYNSGATAIQNVYFTMFDSTLTPIGGKQDVQIATPASGFAAAPCIAFDSTNNQNFLVTFIEVGASSFDIFGQRIKKDGTILDGAGGFAVCDETHNQSEHWLSFDQGSFFEVWSDPRSGPNDIYGTRINPVSGALLDGASNVNKLVFSNGNDKLFPTVTPNGALGYVVGFTDMGGAGSLALVRVASDFSTVDGAETVVSTDIVTSNAPALASNGAGRSLFVHEKLSTQTAVANLFLDQAAGGACSDNAQCNGGSCVGGFCCSTACNAPPSCTVPACPGGACQYVPKAACNFAACELPGIPGCAAPTDTDGDGFSDLQETSDSGASSVPAHQHYIDGNCNGQWDPGELLLQGSDMNKPDIYVYYDWMGYGVDGNKCTFDADCNLGLGHTGETCIAGTCVFSCVSDVSCTGRSPTAAHVGEKCMVFGAGNACMHTHDPEVLTPGALAQVVTAFNNRGLNLHVIPGAAKSHSTVASFRLDADGAHPANVISDSCEGGSVGSGTAGYGMYAASVYDVKGAAPAFPSAAQHVYHYALFSHYSGCDTGPHCGACPQALNPDGSEKNSVSVGESGLAEISGNDFVVSFGNRVNDLAIAPTSTSLAATFMHELGHNLGLHHGGGIDTPCTTGADCPLGVSCIDVGVPSVGKFCVQSDEANYKPNYLSVMNYQFQFTGIQASATANVATPPNPPTAGSNVPDPALTRLDYSFHTLPTGGNTPGALEERNTAGLPGLSEPAGMGSGNTDLTKFFDGTCTPETSQANGVIDWSGDGSTATTNATADLNAYGRVCGLPPTRLGGATDWPATWAGKASIKFTYQFQCLPFFADGAFAPNFLTGGELTTGDAAAAGSLYPVAPARVAVRPGCATSWIAPSSNTDVPVIIYGASDFDVTQIDQSTVRAAGAPIVSAAIADSDGDGFVDLTAEFEMSAMHVTSSTDAITISGSFFSSQQFVGSHSVTVVPAPGPVVTIHNDGTGYSQTLGPPFNDSWVTYSLSDCVDSVVDRCGAPESINAVGTITKITSDERSGCHDTDMAILGPSSFKVERERDGNGDGRVYTIYFNVPDSIGDVTSTSCQVEVKHDNRRGGIAIDSGPHACVGTCP